MDDAVLLQRYARDRSEEAFAELVQRHLNLVYRAALRQMDGDSHRAQDAAQLVFTLLARKAAGLARHTSLTGWLYTATHHTVSHMRRSERRRQHHEQTAGPMIAGIENDDRNPGQWAQLRPALDEAMQQLGEGDREAVLLRVFEGQPFAEVGARLRLSEDAARVRVARALEKLRQILARRGVSSTASAIGLLLAEEAALAAPAGLAAGITGAALAGAAIPAATSGLAMGTVLNFMAASKTTGVILAATILGVGVAFYRTKELGPTKVALAEAQAQIADLRARLDALQREARATKAAQSVQTDPSAAPVTIEPAPAARITREIVDERYARGRELMRSGQYEEGLRELLWCYDEGMPRVSGFGGVRNSFLLEEIAKAGEQYPPALEALRTRRAASEQRMLASSRDLDAMADFAFLNIALKERDGTSALFDSLAADDPRRGPLAGLVFDDLVSSRRYAEAAAGRSYTSMLLLLESSKQLPTAIDQLPNAAEVRAMRQRGIVDNVAKNVEVLAGSNDLAHAREMIGKLLEYDNTPETRARIQESLVRAGHAELMAP